jgi:hypothetical protein
MFKSEPTPNSSERPPSDTGGGDPDNLALFEGRLLSVPSSFGASSFGTGDKILSNGREDLLPGLDNGDS